MLMNHLRLRLVHLSLCLLFSLWQSAVAGTVSSGECSVYTASNTQGAVQNIVDCEIPVMPGDVLHISTCNETTLSGDTYLRLFDPSNTVELAEGDDGCGVDRGGTSMTYVVPIAYPNTGVTLHLHQGCFSTYACGAVTQYTLNVESAPVPHPTPAPRDDDDRYFDIRRCPLAECLDKNDPETGWHECDMCICEDFDEIFLSDYKHDCSADEVYYMCMVKYDVKSVTCKAQMKPEWIAGFFFIAFFGFLFFGSAFGYVIYVLFFARPNKPIQPLFVPENETELQKPGTVVPVQVQVQQYKQEQEMEQEMEHDEEGDQQEEEDPAKVKERKLQLQDTKNNGYSNL